MSRIDVPTLQCDRCKATTQDTQKMIDYHKLSYYHISGKDEWDLCIGCFLKFKAFMKGEI